MAKFIRVYSPRGVGWLVNIDLVQTVRSWEGTTRLVFRAIPGGMDEVQVSGTVEEAEARLLRGEDWPEPAPATAEPPAPARPPRARSEAA